AVATEGGQMQADQVNMIGRVCHEANRALCIVLGDPPSPGWDELEESYRQSTRTGVEAALAGSGPAAMHESWMQERLAAGWQHGTPLDRVAKIHPNLVPYDQLPENQKRKDDLFLAIVGALKEA